MKVLEYPLMRVPILLGISGLFSDPLNHLGDPHVYVLL